MRAVSEVEQEKRRGRKPWMKIEVRGGGGFLVLGGVLIAAGLGAAFAVHRAHINNKRRRSSIRPTDERCKVESLNKGISFDGQLDKVDGESGRGFVSLLTPDPIPPTPSMKLAESCRGESSVHNTAEVQESPSMSKIDQSPTIKNLEIVVATEERILDTDTAACGDNVVQEFSPGGPLQKRNEKASKESELVNLDELKGGTREFSFCGLEFTKLQEKNKQNLEESELAHDNDKEEKDDREEKEEEEEEALSPGELEEFSFRTVESDIIRNQTQQTLEESKLSHDKEDNEEGKEEESSDDIEALSSDQSQEEETELSSVEEEAEREEEGSDGTGNSSLVSSFEAVWPAEAIEQEKDSSLLENHQVTEESFKEKATAAQAEQEIEKYEKFVEELAFEELPRNEIGTGPKTMKMESETGLMAMSYSNRSLLLLLILALAIGLISFVQQDHLHPFHLARILYHVFFDPL